MDFCPKRHAINFQNPAGEAFDDPGLGGTMLTNTTEIGTATLPRRRLTIPAPTDVSPSAPRRPPRFPALAQFASAARRVPRAAIPVAFALAVFAVLATVAPEPAAAQTATTFISNTGQTSNHYSQEVRATAFTTGTVTYTLSSVGIFIPSSLVVGTPAVKFYGDTGGTPGTLLATMTNPGTFADNAVHTFTAPANTTLSASTTYWVVTSNSAKLGGTGFRVGVVGNTTLDSGAAAGWSIGAARLKNYIAAPSWNHSTRRIRFEIRGTNPPTVATAIPDQSATAGTAFSYVFPANTFSDADTSDTLTYTATKADDTALPTWLSFAASTRTFSGTPQAADAGTVSVKVTASDGNGGSVSDAFDITVIISVPSNWTLKPTALAAGAKFRLLFLSSTPTAVSSTDIADYNTFIQTRAAAGHTDIRAYSAGFRVVGCTAAVDARDNTKTTYTTTDKGVPIYWLNGAKAADQYEDFYDGSWDDEANDKNESGTNGPDTSQAGNWPLTGCSHDGTEQWPLGASQVSVGRPNSSGSGHGPLFANAQITSGVTSLLYGLSAVFEVAAAVVVPNNPPTVANAIPDQSATAGTAFSYVFPANTFSDADTGDTLSYTATKTDDTALPTWLAFAAGTRTFSGTPQAADAGTVAVKVTASDGNGGSVSDTFDITVAADTTPPTLTSATVTGGGTHIELQFSENIPLLNQPPGSAFTVTADGGAVTTPFSPTWAHPSTPDLLRLQVSPVIIFQGQAVVVTYTDPTAGDDANAIQDTAGNDAATFTTGMNGVPAVTNNSIVTNTPATGAPTITGTAQVGQTLTAGTAAIMDADGLTSVSYTYQWIRTAAGVDTNISGATASTYTLVTADLGTTIKVTVSFTDDASKAETRTSAATAAVSAAPNTPATGAPTITGTAQVGQTLTAGTTAIVDADGLTSVSYAYQWIRVATDNTETNISSATVTYTLVAADQGTTIKVTVSFTDDASNPETLTSAATAAVSAAANTPATGAPTITGMAQVGQTLTAGTTAIMDADGLTNVSYTYQWIRVATDNTETNISGATASTHTLVAADQGTTIKVTVSFTDDASNAETLTSAATAAVAAAPNTPATGAATITGTPQVGQTLTAATTAIMDADGLTNVSYTYQWIRVATDNTETNISGATASTYTLVAADLGTTIKVKVSFTDDASNPETLTSAATAAVSAAANTPATGAPTITGTAQVGQTLTASTTGIADANGLTTPNYTYQWIRVDGTEAAIAAANSSTYTLVDADLGTTIKVRVSFTDDASNSETLTSAATATVGAPGGGGGGGGGTGGGGGGGGGGGNDEPTANTDPVITTPGPFDVEENQTRVVRVEALDSDPGDAIRSYAIAGGSDGALFSIVAHTGVLSFREPPNFEAPADVLSTDPPSEAGDNEYIVVVRVASGPLARDRTVEQAFAVRVIDADRESPGTPGAPRVTLALEASLTVEWDEPENPGPPITGYDVQYREGTSGFFINAPHEGTGRTATLTGLEAATLYQVQVRARNEEGTGRWSEPGEWLTLAGPTAVLPFSVPDRGGISVTSQDAEPILRVGYGQVETDDGMASPAGLAIFSSRVNGILVSEAGFPAVPPVLEGRIFAETDGVVRTGLAMANPNDTTATVAFFFTNSDGIDSGHGTFTLGPREQTAQFLDEAPFNGGSEMWGTFTFTADLPVAVIALRGFVNERSEFLMTTLPVAPIAVPTTGTVYFPHFAAGGGWTTQVILVNPTHALISGNVQFVSSGSQTEAAAPATLTLADGRNGSTFSYAIPPRSATRLRTSNPAGPLEVGSVRAVPDPGQPAPSGVSIFAFQKDGMTVSEAGVTASTSGAAFRVYVEASGTPGQPHAVRSGIALTNTSDAPTTVSLELTDLDGTATGLPESLTIPASGHIARFIDEFFPALTTPFSGILRIASTAPDIAAVGLRLAINPRHDILVTTTPPVDENAAAAASGLFFPHFVDSDGWTTQFILFSGSPGQTAAGMIRFTGQDGQPLELSVAPTTAPMIP